MGSPLGKYSDIAATLVGIGVVAAWITVHVILILATSFGHTGSSADTSQIDLAATLVLGVVLGQRATTNGASIVARSANLRLDAIGAPTAAVAAATLAAALPPATLPPVGPTGQV
jgi:hypothetical protein